VQQIAEGDRLAEDEAVPVAGSIHPLASHGHVKIGADVGVTDVFLEAVIDARTVKIYLCRRGQGEEEWDDRFRSTRGCALGRVLL
jgi:hypothetical protein